MLSTSNNRLDLDDWLAIAGVDPFRVFNEVVEVSSSSSSGLLDQHLLLVEGRFDRTRIFQAALDNGARRSLREGVEVLEVKTYARESRELSGARWLAIVEDRIAVLGTPDLVRQALGRLAAHASPDQLLIARLAHFGSDISSWNILESAVESDGDLLQLNPAWAHLLEGADVLTVGVHFGPHIRVDLGVWNETFARSRANAVRLEDFSGVLSLPDSVESADIRAGRRVSGQTRLQNPRLGPGGAQCSITLSREQFELWSAEVSRRKALQSAGSNVAVAGTN